MVQESYKYSVVTHPAEIGMPVAAETRHLKNASLPPRCGNLSRRGWARDGLAPWLGSRSHYLGRVI